MKIKLVAFSGAWEMSGNVMVPDNTPPEIRVSLPTQIPVFLGDKYVDTVTGEMCCIFEFCGERTHDGEPIYRLTNIYGGRQNENNNNLRKV